MEYITVYSNWKPYAQMSDPRGFISRRFGGGHTGVDSVGNALDNPVCAVIGGTVTAVYWSDTYGNVVEYGRGALRVTCCHLAKALVAVGDAVRAGETVVGVEGATGSYADGKHLHTSLRIHGVLTDPEPYLSGRKAFDEEDDEMKYQVGDTVVVTGRIYTSAWGAEPSIAGGGRSYRITAIANYTGVTRPYQLGAAGFCADGDIAADAPSGEVAQLRRELEAANAKLAAIRQVMDG